MKENSIEEDIKNAEHFIKSIKTDKEYKEENGWHGYYNKEIVELARILQHILSDYKRVLKENELLRKDIEGWKKYCEEIEEEQTEISNKNCKLEFEIEKLQKENEDLHREINQRIKLKIENEKIVDTQFIPVQKVKDKISERQFELQQEYKDFEDDSILTVLQELIEGKK